MTKYIVIIIKYIDSVEKGVHSAQYTCILITSLETQFYLKFSLKQSTPELQI